MTSAVITFTEFDGLQPALDIRQRTKPGLLDCRNTLLDAQGPYSGPGDQLVSEQVFSSYNRFQTFEVNGHEIICLPGLLARFDTATGRYYPVFQYTEPSNDFPWSFAQVGTAYYMARLGVGYVQYSPSTDQWQILSGGSIPADVYAICECAGRSIVLSATYISWSTTDDGTDFITSEVTGAGAQALAVLGSGTPLGIAPNPLGFVVFTTTGMCLMRLVNAVSPFFFSRIATKELPINPWCIINIGADASAPTQNVYGQTVGPESQLIYISRQGFHWIPSTTPVAWHPEMGEYFARTLLKGLGSNLASDLTCVRVDYDPTNQLFFISVRGAYKYKYQRTFVMYMFNQKWGSFDELHYGLGEIYLSSGASTGFNFGYLGNDGLFHRFVDLPRRESSALGTDKVFWQPHFDPPAQFCGSYTIIFATGAQGGEDPSQFPVSTPGVYEFNSVISATESIAAGSESSSSVAWLFEDWNTLSGAEDWNVMTGADDWSSGGSIPLVMMTQAAGRNYLDVYKWQLVGSNFSTIDSWADIGLIKLDAPPPGAFHDMTSTINGMVLGCNQQTLFSYEDYETSQLGNEDWNAITASEDWGSDVPTTNQFGLTFQSTLDGSSVWNGQDQNFNTPDIVTDNSVFYNFTSSGIYHRFRVTAQNDNEYYHIKLAAITGTLGGRV